MAVAFQPINYAQIQPQGLPLFRNLGEDIRQSAMFPQELRQAQLENMIKQVQANFAQPFAEQDLQKAKLYNQYYAPDIQSQIGLRGAQAGLAGSETQKNKYLLEHPGLMGGDAAKEIQSLMDLGLVNKDQLSKSNFNGQQNSQSGFNPAPFQTGNGLVDSLLNKPFAQMAYQQRMNQAFNWVHSPVDAKNYMVAQLAGAGVDPSEAVNLLSSGKTVPEILQSHGFDPSNAPEPDYLPTRGNVQQLNQRKAAMAAVNSLGDAVREGLGPYSQTIGGLSPQQTLDAIMGRNKEEQVKFLAARAIVPELTTMRLTASGGRATVHAIEAMQNASLNQIKSIRALIPKDVWIAAQKEIDDQINKAMNAANDSYKVGKSESSPKSSNTQSNDPFGLL